MQVTVCLLHHIYRYSLLLAPVFGTAVFSINAGVDYDQDGSSRAPNTPYRRSSRIDENLYESRLHEVHADPDRNAKPGGRETGAGNTDAVLCITAADLCTVDC